MNYYIKVGKMYVYDIYVDSDCIKTEFIKRIDFKNVKDNCMKICKEEQSCYISKLEKILEIVNPMQSITFEEVEEEEENKNE